ncbi:type IV pilus modification PilV family protein [Paenibacillus glufosinatiresistens]|uniref:type IV pilus modification PilV family protein n=1 Tax=Paenibacillus glufosinatiresistens TaxID=3070657 RepID=UPI00286DDB7F|nr:prepilin-type N-terminal cleavage/methylation domain-containing protein [Paenibacillus sp. YX.27]
MRREDGFTLIEVLASIVILSIVSLVLTAYFTNALSYTKSNQNKTIMVNLARNALFYMEKQDFDQMKDFFVTGKHALKGDDCKLNSCVKPEYAAHFNTGTLASVLHPNVNGIEYSIDIEYQQELAEPRPSPSPGAASPNAIDRSVIRQYLVPVRVMVRQAENGSGRAPVVVEGYISDEEIR